MQAFGGRSFVCVSPEEMFLLYTQNAIHETAAVHVLKKEVKLVQL